MLKCLPKQNAWINSKRCRSTHTTHARTCAWTCVWVYEHRTAVMCTLYTYAGNDMLLIRDVWLNLNISRCSLAALRPYTKKTSPPKFYRFHITAGEMWKWMSKWNANQMAIFRYLHFRLADIMFTFQNKKEQKRKEELSKWWNRMEFGDCAVFNATPFHFSTQITSRWQCIAFGSRKYKNILLNEQFSLHSFHPYAHTFYVPLEIFFYENELKSCELFNFKSIILVKCLWHPLIKQSIARSKYRTGIRMVNVCDTVYDLL